MIALQQTVVPAYRDEFLACLSEYCEGALVVWAGEEYFDRTTRTNTSYAGPLVRVRNRFFMGRRVGWQHGVVRPLIGADAAVLELNPRLLSNWAVLLGRAARRRPTVLWGHAWSRGGAAARSNAVRRWMRRLASRTVVYTETERRDLEAAEPGLVVHAAPNALYRRDVIAAGETASQTDILWAGRLVASKKPMLLVEAFIAAAGRGLGEDIRLVLLGDGPERPHLEHRLGEAGLSGRVSLAGYVPPADVRPFYDRALITVSTGYVGLSMVQSFSFGVPMLYARDEPHAPEVEAAVEGFNARAFASDDPSALADALLEVDRDRETWMAARSEIAAACSERYSVELMASRLAEAAQASSAAK